MISRILAIVFVCILSMAPILTQAFSQPEPGKERVMLECTPEDPNTLPLGAPGRFSLTSVSAAEAPYGRFYLKVHVPRPNQPAPIALDRMPYFGSTVIAYENRGKSGYVLFYAHRSGKALIDINLFGRDDVNTGGPLLNFRCFRPEVEVDPNPEL